MFAIVWPGPECRAIGPFTSSTQATTYIDTDPDLKCSPGVCVLPLDAPAEVVPAPGSAGEPACGCYAGIDIFNGCELQRCDDCQVVADDDEAIAIVRDLLARRVKDLVAPEPPF